MANYANKQVFEYLYLELVLRFSLTVDLTLGSW